MGMALDVRFSDSTTPAWLAIRDRLLSVGDSPVLRMLDGLPAFPDEQPEEGWRELRISLDGTMITLRRSPEGFSCVAWGNTDANGERAWKRLAWACAMAGSGKIVSLTGVQTAEEFASEKQLFSS